jgi:hypothetical protein
VEILNLTPGTLNIIFASRHVARGRKLSLKGRASQ